MGRIFTFKQVLEDCVPRMDDFSKVVQKIKSEFDDDKSVLGAVLCGSFALGNHNPRSDLDCLLIYQPNRFSPIEYQLQSINSFAESFNVRVEFIPIEKEVAEKSLHAIGHSFFAHIERSLKSGGLVKKNPLPFIKLRKSDPRVEVLRYLINKMHSLNKGLARMNTMEETELCRFLQKVLEAPIHVARKMLWLTGKKLRDDSRKEIVVCYSKMMTDRLIKQPFSELVRIDNFYSEQLAEGNLSSKRCHEDMISMISENAYQSLDFVRSNALLIS